eukprot:6080779-Pleurochrysis_carterae.AAC.1
MDRLAPRTVKPSACASTRGCARTAMTHNSAPVETREMNRATGTAVPSAAASMPLARTSLPVETARAGATDAMERRSTGPRRSW